VPRISDIDELCSWLDSALREPLTRATSAAPAIEAGRPNPTLWSLFATSCRAKVMPTHGQNALLSRSSAITL
jgi:hypothetical protein